MNKNPNNKPSLIWGNLVHLSMNMWFDCGLKNLPKNIRASHCQHNWWYYTKLEPKTTLVRCNPQGHGMDKLLELKPVQAYLSLEKHGYDQVLTGSNVTRPDNMQATVNFALKNIERQHLHGFLMTTWRAMLPANRKRQFEAVA